MILIMKNIRGPQDLFFHKFKHFHKNILFLLQRMLNRYAFTFRNDLEFCIVIVFTSIHEEILRIPSSNEKKQLLLKSIITA